MSEWVIDLGQERDWAEKKPENMREWLVTNALGGYASGTVLGIPTRRYHGLLIAALPAPNGRRMMLNHLSESVRLSEGTATGLGLGPRFAGQSGQRTVDHLQEFKLEDGLPVWKFEVAGTALEKRVLLPHLQNTVHVHYHLLSGPHPISLILRPWFHLRFHDHPVGPLPDPGYHWEAKEDAHVLSDGKFPSLTLWLESPHLRFVKEPGKMEDIYYAMEAERGYPSTGGLWNPGYYQANLAPGQDITLSASTEAKETARAFHPREAFRAEHRRRQRLLLEHAPVQFQKGPGPTLLWAADQFIVAPAGRVEDVARAHAVGDEVRSVIAGYHWFNDWGRDTMISLEGLTLTTGRHAEANYILRTFETYIRHGLVPNMFPEGQKDGCYNTADATLWFFHAIDRYVHWTKDREMLRFLLPRLRHIMEHHFAGTIYGIGMDPSDGLLRQGTQGLPLTWMDAKVGDWVVTPRRGKAVEINALWYNALRLLEGWVREEHGEEAARPLRQQAEKTRKSFNQRFWYPQGGYLYDIVDGEQGDDASCRPNQVFAISLTHPVLEPEHWKPVLEVVQDRLLTPFGLRSLAPGHPDFQPKYFGDRRARDAAYHQGTVWPWLIGPFVDAWLRVHPGDRQGARGFLEGLLGSLERDCMGSISEICDAEPPFTPRGCIAQAWSIAEVLRCWFETSA